MSYTARALRVDLSTGKTREEELGPDVTRKWVGGTGLGVKYLYDEIGPEIAWDSPDNKVFLATGPLANTRVSGTGIFSAVFKGPMNNLAGCTQANGFLGAFLRSQGYEALILEGVAPALTHLHLDENGVSLRDAEHLAGIGTWELEDRVRGEMGLDEKRLSVFGIGPAGERRARFAVLVGDRGHVASKNGLGAVLGAKRLKAISVKRGSVKAYVADPARLNQLVTPLFEHARDAGGGRHYQYGTAGGLSGASLGGWLPTRNYTTSIYPEHELMGGQYVRSHFPLKNNPCWACRMACCKLIDVSGAPNPSFVYEEPEYEGMAAMGPQIGVVDTAMTIRLANECDAVGIDINEAGWLIGWVMECFEKGLLSTRDLDGIEAHWGDGEAASALTRKIGTGEGCGAWLGEGVKRASEHVGGAAAEMAIYTLKGQTPRGHDHRGRWAEMLDTATSSTGTIEVTYGGVQTERLGLQPLKDRFSPDEIPEQMARLNGWHQFEDSLGICRFVFTSADLGVQTTNAISGWDLSLEEALTIGRRISAQLRIWSFVHGLDPSLERPSTRYGSVPVDGPAAGADIRPHWDHMVSRFRTLIGWEPTLGLPLPETLRALDLEDLVPVAAQFESRVGAPA